MSSDHKAVRISQACDTCHKRGRRCRIGDDESESCLTCVEAGLICTRNRPAAKRGPKPGSRRFARAASTTDAVARHEIEQFLIDSFFEYVYPIVNYIHETSFRESLKNGRPQSNNALYTRYMAMCTLSAYRAVHGTNPAPAHLLSRMQPEYYLQHAINASNFAPSSHRNLADLQAIAILSVVGLEIGDASLIQRFMGIYHAALAGQCLSDESRWPSGLSDIEIEQRRRLFWHMYRLEVHMALVMGHAIRCPELQSLVAYPDDQDGTVSGESEWLAGWNFVTDLYRGLEHLLTKVRLLRNGGARQRSALSTTFLVEYSHSDQILEPLTLAFDSLPVKFQRAEPMSANVTQNRCGFQTANIVCTFLLLKMVSYSWNRATLKEACSTALELVDKITSIPLEYLKTMSLAMVQELSGFGYILSNFIGTGLPRSEHKKLKTVILCMAEFLESLDSNMSYSQRASLQLREYARTIDDLLRPETRDNHDDASTPVEPEPIFQTSVDSFFNDENETFLDFANIMPWMDESGTGFWDHC